MGRRHANAATAASSCLELASLHANSVSTSSVAGSACSYNLDNDDADDVRLDDFERRLDSLFEKRGSTRERALEALAVMLRVDYRADECHAHSETLTSRCLVALKRGSAVEGSLAAQLLGLYVLTLGQPNESLFNTLRPELERSAGGAHGGGGAVAAAAVDSLALAAFVLCEDEAGTRAVMERLRVLWAKGEPKPRAAAVRGWAFLLTSLDCNLTDAEAGACLAALAGLLGERDLELRTAAGEAVAVLRACCSAGVLAVLGEGEEGEEEDEEVEVDGEGEEWHRVAPAAAAETGNEHMQGGKGSGGGGRRRSSAANACNGNGHAEEVLERMQELAANKGDKLRRSRRERAAQRSTFRSLLAALSGEELPAARVKLQHGDCLDVEGAAATHRLAFLRRFLAGGFQAHLQRNPLLHDVFGFQPRAERVERMSAVEKRMTRSCQSADAKARAANRQWNRDAKASRMMEF